MNVFVKDLRAGAIFLWAVVPLYVLAGLQVLDHGRGLFWANVVCASLLVVGVCMLDWKNEADLFVHSLPVTRAMVVRGRYVTAIAAGILSLIVGSALGAVGGLILVARGGAWPRWMAPDVGFAFVLAYACVVSIYLPCHYRWGFGRGNVAAALLLAVSVLARDLVGPILGPKPAAGAAPAGLAGVPPGYIPEGVVRLFALHGPVVAGAVVLGITAAVLYASQKVAVLACRRREF